MDLFKAWTWKMAWRDSRSSRRRLLLFSLSISIGIAAVVAVSSLGDNLKTAIENQSKELLGADLVIRSRRPFSAEENQVLEKTGPLRSREIAFSSMIRFPETGASRFVQIRAHENGFPYYGQLEASPSDAVTRFRNGEGVLLEETLMNFFEARIGDVIQVGEWKGPIVGWLQNIPGESFVFSALAPRVFFPLSDLEETKLIQAQSRARYKVHFRLDKDTNISRLMDSLQSTMNHYRWQHDTVEKRKRNLGRSMDHLHRFLQLVGFIALFLGGVGIAGAVHIHVKSKLMTAAVLRCFVATVSMTYSIYLIQGLAMGVFGSLVGGALGLMVQFAIPGILADLIPVEYDVFISWPAVLRSLGIGILICLLFTLLPLTVIRRVSPLAAFRSSYETGSRRSWDGFQVVLYLVLFLGVFVFAWSQMRKWPQAVGFTFGLLSVFGVLFLMSKGLMFLATKIIRPSWPYTIRQGLANLFRPNNRTVMLMISMGLGTFLILTLYLVQETLVHAFDPAVGSLRPNVILFDIQQDQVEGVRQVILEEGFQMLDRVPIVTMQLLSINDESVESFLKNPESSVEKWALRREYRCTYRESLSDSEKLIQGDWIPRFTGDIEGVIPVSIEEGIAEALDIGLGDRLIFDVQGLSIQTQIRSMRQVDWKRAEPNFFVVFPVGILEDAPGFHIVTTRVDSAAASARLQKAIVGKYANISMVDLNLIMNTLDHILSRMTYVVKFMTLFTLLTGLAVLVSTVWNSRMQRLQEFILLRILGASRNQIIQIQVFEYLILGTLAAATGALLSIAAGWGLARFFFEIPFRMNWEMLLLAFATVSLMTLPVGMLSLRGLFLQPPLEVLRRES